jgi:hypothetical protein
MNRSITISALIGCLMLSACSKYAMRGDDKGAAYLRVFNDIPFTLDLTTKTDVVPFFTMLIDPVFSNKGVPTGGQVVGDYLGSRLRFDPSTAVNEGNPLGTPLDTSIRYNINYEYPGNAHVLAAPSINGLDLSAWAQVNSGKHRVLFIARPQNDIGFAQLSDTIRNSVIIDTTIDLQEGEVYTMETVLQDVDAVKYGLYLRQETFTHQTFDLSKNYVTFFNLSGKNSSLSSNSISPTSQYFYDTMNVSYTYYDPTLPGGSAAIQGFQNVYLMTMEGRMTASAPYLPLPVLPLSSFYDNTGVLKTYNEFGNTGETYGTMPYFVFNFIASGNNVPSSPTGQSYTLTCQWDPITVNTLSGYALQNLGAVNANLNMLVQVDGKTAVFPAVYVMELVFNQIFIMQVQQKI